MAKDVDIVSDAGQESLLVDHFHVVLVVHQDFLQAVDLVLEDVLAVGVWICVYYALQSLVVLVA